MSTKQVYLDVCILCRPFDDQQQGRVRLETAAFDLILSQVEASALHLIVSPVHQAEIGAIYDAEMRQQLLMLLDRLGNQPDYDFSTVRQRAEMLADKGMGVADAAHVAFAEAAHADFVTVDDRLLRQCLRLNVTVWCGTPLAYCDKENLR